MTSPARHAIEHQRLARRAARAVDGIGPHVQQVRAIVFAGAAERRPAERNRLPAPSGILQVIGPPHRLRFRVDVLGRLRREFLELCGRPAEGLWRYAVAANRQREARRRSLDEVALDMHVVPETHPEETRELAQGNPGLGHLQLDLTRPGIGQVQPLYIATGGILETAEFVEESAGDDLS